MDIHIAELFLDAKEQILESREYSSKHKIKALFNLLTTILEEVTQSEKIVFTTLFSRASFIANKYRVDSDLMFYLHTFRRDNERMKIGSHSSRYLDLGVYVIDQLIGLLFYGKNTIDSIDMELESFFKQRQSEIVKFKPVIEAIIEDVDLASYEVFFYEEEDASMLKCAKFDQLDKNELFSDIIQRVKESVVFPIHANFIDVEILNDGKCIPQAIVLMPDYLIDVTAIANCFKDYGSISILRLLSKFKKVENSIPLAVGNIANLFLDEIISDPEIKFSDLLPKIFRLDPLGISNFSDDDIRELVSNSRNHYMNLKKSVAVELPLQGIQRDRVFLEPSFYSRDYGLQGRLDLFHLEKSKNQFDIIELKSGKPYRANIYGLSASHYSQTLLYDLMIKSTFGYQNKPNNYILYSKLNEKTLKYAPPVKSQQYEAMRIRNELILMEIKMAKSATDAEQLLDYLRAGNFPEVKGFELKDLEKFERIFSKLNTYERSYFTSFSSFIAREQRMAKTGEHGINKSNGLAALWLENIEEKEERFSVLKALTIKENKSREMVPSLVLSRQEETSRLANFRKGDIAVLYPYDYASKSVLKDQIFKCTILEIDQFEVKVKLRSKQYNDVLFKSIDRWNIESDTLDSSFNTLYRSLYEFCQANQNTKDLWLGIKPPRSYSLNEYKEVDGLTGQQNMILRQMIDTKDYFLLWGPPGTGKTSIMLKFLTEQLFVESQENILLLAYTNRAVDEICASIESIEPGFEENYFRIGSSTSCGERFKPRLLDRLIDTMTNRKEIRSFIQSKRIVVSTVASMMGKNELFKLKTFDRVIIDEASQILEPMLLGLLSRIEKTILIGDHKQLPAVVTQRESDSKIQSQILLGLGIVDMRMSLFERLYYRCKHMNWDHAFGLLSHQGRMHSDIMRFPNAHFYNGQLNILPGIDRLTGKRNMFTQSPSEQFLIDERFIFIPTQTDLAFNWKTNKYESDAVLNVVSRIVELYKVNAKDFTNDTLGIITPYRAQIATIRNAFEGSFPELLKFISIDTVERYQGGARDIIIISLCTNKLSQLTSLVSLSEEGIDRKLNVAMTRAREQLFVLGNEAILQTNATYASLIQEAYTQKDQIT